jgi:hypothetical protein
MTQEEVEFLTTPAKRITKKKVFTVGAIGIAAFATLLIIDDQVKKLRGGRAEDTTPEV